MNLNATKNDILKVDAQLSALKSYVNCEFSILRNQIESFTGHTKMSLGHENSNEDALHKNIAFLQNELIEKNKKKKKNQIPNGNSNSHARFNDKLKATTGTPEQNVTEHLSQEKFNQKPHN